MKALFSEIRRAVFATLVLAIVCCGLYPLVVFGISQALFRDKANGSLIVDQDGTVHGSKLLAQGFTADKYFRPRAESCVLRDSPPTNPFIRVLPLPATAMTRRVPAEVIWGRLHRS